MTIHRFPINYQRGPSVIQSAFFACLRQMDSLFRLCHWCHRGRYAISTRWHQWRLSLPWHSSHAIQQPRVCYSTTICTPTLLTVHKPNHCLLEDPVLSNERCLERRLWSQQRARWALTMCASVPDQRLRRLIINASYLSSIFVSKRRQNQWCQSPRQGQVLCFQTRLLPSHSLHLWGRCCWCHWPGPGIGLQCWTSQRSTPHPVCWWAHPWCCRGGNRRQQPDWAVRSPSRLCRTSLWSAWRGRSRAAGAQHWRPGEPVRPPAWRSLGSFAHRPGWGLERGLPYHSCLIRFPLGFLQR